ncbi:MAG TPA: hypothetical protein VGF99_08860 [Myxococcota bacterium]
MATAASSSRPDAPLRHDRRGVRPALWRPRPARCPWDAAARLLSAVVVVAASTVPSSARAQQQVVHTDKLKHAGASAAIVDAVWLAAALLDQPLPVRLGASVVVGAAAGVGKELYDLAGYGTPDVDDLLFDAYGIGLGVGVALVVEVIAHDLLQSVDEDTGALPEP